MAQRSGSTLRTVLRMVLVIAEVALVLYVAHRDPVRHSLRRMQAERLRLEAERATLIEENEELALQLRLLRRPGALALKVARERLGLVRDEELLLVEPQRLVPPLLDSPPPPSDQPPAGFLPGTPTKP